MIGYRLTLCFVYGCALSQVVGAFTPGYWVLSFLFFVALNMPTEK